MSATTRTAHTTSNTNFWTRFGRRSMAGGLVGLASLGALSNPVGAQEAMVGCGTGETTYSIELPEHDQVRLLAGSTATATASLGLDQVLAAGDYDVEVLTYDDHANFPWRVQSHERLYVSIGGSITPEATPDVPEDADWMGASAVADDDGDITTMPASLATDPGAPIGTISISDPASSVEFIHYEEINGYQGQYNAQSVAVRRVTLTCAETEVAPTTAAPTTAAPTTAAPTTAAPAPTAPTTAAPTTAAPTTAAPTTAAPSTTEEPVEVKGIDVTVTPAPVAPLGGGAAPVAPAPAPVAAATPAPVAAPTPAPVAATPATAPAAALPATGSQSTELSLFGTALLTAGGALHVARRRAEQG